MEDEDFWKEEAALATESRVVIDQLKGGQLYDMFSLRPANYNASIQDTVKTGAKPKKNKDGDGSGEKNQGPDDDVGLPVQKKGIAEQKTEE